MLEPQIPTPVTIIDLTKNQNFLANRLKRVLPSLVSKSQSAFVPGGLILDNILMAFEIMHQMKSRSHVNCFWVEWDFPRLLMLKMGFLEKWVQLVMACVFGLVYCNDEWVSPWSHFAGTMTSPR
ncbi:uncharacterized protein LOC119983440 [Tripterygium wilfordii]|uniref:uncharacterized protein LOC119983440 n=1 Tax=Tripterygium wilfordii TaxID=458696 RepID=UPI0018F7E81A|nr:uncharacterized protein LOC119983440 [Tripterygium wilfordii]